MCACVTRGPGWRGGDSWKRMGDENLKEKLSRYRERKKESAWCTRTFQRYLAWGNRHTEGYRSVFKQKLIRNIMISFIAIFQTESKMGLIEIWTKPKTLLLVLLACIYAYIWIDVVCVTYVDVVFPTAPEFVEMEERKGKKSNWMI